MSPSRRILCAEDDPEQLRALVAFLRARGFEVSAARSLAEARAAVATTTFDYVLTDFDLGDGTAVDLLDEAGIADAKTVFITGRGTEGLPDDVDTLRKPLDFRSLDESLARLRVI